MSMWVDLRIAENSRHSIFKSFRNKVLKPLGFLMHFVPGILQNIVKKQFQQAVMPDQFPRSPFARGSEPGAPMFFI